LVFAVCGILGAKKAFLEQNLCVFCWRVGENAMGARSGERRKKVTLRRLFNGYYIDIQEYIVYNQVNGHYVFLKGVI
jgi:hypothetical protein